MARGCAAMTLGPVTRQNDGSVVLHLLVEAVSLAWRSEVDRGGMLPSIGFTSLSPRDVDQKGGLPEQMEFTGNSLVVLGDGSVCRRRAGGMFSRGNDLFARIPPGEVERRSGKLAPGYTMRAGQLLTVTWRPGSLKITADGDTVLDYADSPEEHFALVDTPPPGPVYAVVDCCCAVSRIRIP